MRIRFSDDDLLLVDWFVETDQALKNAHHVVDRRITRRKSSHQVSYEGFLGELAVARALDLTLVFRPSIRGDGGAGDLTLPDGRTISVKYTGYDFGDFALRSTNDDEFKDDLGVLTGPLSPDGYAIPIVGYVTRAQFERGAVIANHGYGDRLVYPRRLLRPIEELVAEVNRMRGIAA